MFFFAKPSFSSFMRAMRKKKLEPEKLFFLQSHACMNFTRLVRKNNFLEPEKLFFCKASVFFKLLRKTMFQVPIAYPHMDFGWIGSSPSMCEKNISELEKLFFCKAQFHPVRQYKGSRQKNERAKGNCKPHV